MFIRTRLAVALSVAMIVVTSAQTPRRTGAQSADPFVGTWILNLEKSTFENQAAPKSVIRTFDYERDGLILVTANTTSTAGTSSFVHYLFTLDGREYEEMTRAAPSADRQPTFVSATKVNDRALNLVFKSGGKVTITHEWTVADDGMVWTARRTASDAQGRRMFSKQVYDKQK